MGQKVMHGEHDRAESRSKHFEPKFRGRFKVFDFIMTSYGKQRDIFGAILEFFLRMNIARVQ
jgi:hypothetical protein